jgi:UDP-N-acetylglucosamine acyltransferase
MISSHAIVDPKARVSADAEIGPLCIIGPDVEIAAGCRLVSNVTIMGRTTLGPGNTVWPGAVLGAPPQDRKYKGAPTRLEIGANNIFREHVTIHIGTERGGGVTRVGDNNFLMVNAHLGHDVQLGSNCMLANNVMVAGHVIMGDYCNLMGGVGIHHFVTVGRCCFLGGYARIHHDAPPFCKIDGADEMRGLNIKGLTMAGYPEADIQALEEAYTRLFERDRSTPFAQALASFDTLNGLNPHVKHLVEFLRQRSIVRHGRYLQARRVR